MGSKLLENSKLALVCCSDEWRGWVSSNRPSSESSTATSPYHPLELTGSFLVTVHRLFLLLFNVYGRKYILNVIENFGFKFTPNFFKDHVSYHVSFHDKFGYMGCCD